MNQFTEIRIDGFRRLCGIELPLKPLNVVIGANGVGKTSLLDVFDVLAASAEGDLSQAINDRAGISSILTRTTNNAETSRNGLQFNLRGTVDSESSLEYELSLQRVLMSYFQISREALSQTVDGDPFYLLDCVGSDIEWFDSNAREIVRFPRPPGNEETALSQVQRPMFSYLSPMEQFRQTLSQTTMCRAIDVGRLSPVRLPQPLTPTGWPGHNGEHLVSCLYSMRESHSDRYVAVEDALRAAFPSFRALGFPPVAAGTLSMTWTDACFSEPLYMNELSEGTLRFLWLITLLQSPGLPSVTLIDEPEISLHPELLSLLAELFREASTRTQLIVATQSDSLIRFLKPEEVVVMDIGEDGLATATRADTMDLDNWLKDYTLDEVWRMGRMGGRS